MKYITARSQDGYYRVAEIRDDVHLVDEGAVDAIAFRVADADMRAAPGGVTRGAEGKAQWRKQVIGQEGSIVRHQNRFCTQCIHSRVEEWSQCLFHRKHREHWRGASQKSLDAWSGLIVEIEFEWIVLPPPTPDGRSYLILQWLY